MNFEKLDNASADPRPKWKLAVENIVAIRLRGVTSEAAAIILMELVAALDGRLASVFERAAFAEAAAILTEFDGAVLKDAQAYHERQRKLADTGVEELVEALLAHGWNALERRSIDRKLAALRERLARVDFRWIETMSGLRVTRSEIQADAMPVTVTNGKWASNFISEAGLRELEADAAEKSARLSAPPTYGRNMDLPPGGVRPGVSR